MKNILFSDDEKESLKKFLENESILKIGVGINDNDLQKMKSEFPNINPGGFTDLRNIMYQFSNDSMDLTKSMDGFIEENFGWKPDKKREKDPRYMTETFSHESENKEGRKGGVTGQKLNQSNWRNEILSKDQITYACLDAIAPMAVLQKEVKEKYGLTEKKDIIDKIYNESVALIGFSTSKEDKNAMGFSKEKKKKLQKEDQVSKEGNNPVDSQEVEIDGKLFTEENKDQI